MIAYRIILTVCFTIFFFMCSNSGYTPADSWNRYGTHKTSPISMRLAVSPKNNLVLVGSTNHSFNLWDLSTGQKLKSFKMSSSFIGSGFWTENILLPGCAKALSSRTSIKIWDIETGRELRKFRSLLGTWQSPDAGFALIIGPDNATASIFLILTQAKS